MKQLVDSFSPIGTVRLHKSLEPQYGSKWFRLPEPPRSSINPQPVSSTKLPKKPASSLEGILSESVQPQRSHTRQKTSTIPYAKLIRPHVVPKAFKTSQANKRLPYEPSQSLRPYQQVPSVKSTKTRKRSAISKVLRIVQFPFIVIVAVIVGLLMQTLIFGEIAIGIYAVLALLLRFSSRTTFQLAFITLIGILLLSAIGKDITLATNFAVYTFLLLGVGTILLIRENYQTISA